MPQEYLSRREFLLKSARVGIGAALLLDGFDRFNYNGGVNKCVTQPTGAGEAWASGLCEQTSKLAFYETSRRDMFSKVTGLFSGNFQSLTRDWSINRLGGIFEMVGGIAIGLESGVEIVDHTINSRTYNE